MRIVQWLRQGEMEAVATTDELIEDAGTKLDKVCSWDICGDVVFRAEDGKWYALVVEARLEEVNGEYLKEVLADEAG